MRRHAHRRLGIAPVAGLLVQHFRRFVRRQSRRPSRDPAFLEMTVQGRLRQAEKLRDPPNAQTLGPKPAGLRRARRVNRRPAAGLARLVETGVPFFAKPAHGAGDRRPADAKGGDDFLGRRQSAIDELADHAVARPAILVGMAVDRLQIDEIGRGSIPADHGQGGADRNGVCGTHRQGRKGHGITRL